MVTITHVFSSNGDGDESRTPGRSGAWDPTVSNTPAQQPGNFENYDFDESSPSPNYNQVNVSELVQPGMFLCCL